MAVEKMKMMNVVGDLSYMDNVIIDILRLKSVNIINSQLEIDSNAFAFNLESEENIEKTIELNYVSPFEKDSSKELIVKRARELMNFFSFKSIEDKYIGDLKENFDFDKFYNDLKVKIDRLDYINKEIKKTESIESNYDLFRNVEIDLSDLANLKYFTARFGILDKEARFRFKKNYGNILAMIYHTATIENNEVYLAIYPNEVSNEIDRVLKSLNWIDVDILGKNRGTAEDILGGLSKKKEALLKEKKEIEDYRDSLINEKEDELKKILARMLLNEKIEEVKKSMARSNKFFYLSGWIAVSDIDDMKKVLMEYDDLSLDFRTPEEMKVTPPTKLKNRNFFKPFELLINMYGTPNYKELDPTVFLGLTYMVLFGAMFGDLGQGAIFFLGGLILSKKGNDGFGALLRRLGLSSMVFGVLYGSVFGSEEILPAIWMRPFENINQVLGISVGFGVLLLVIAYVLGFVNKIRNNEVEEAVFGKDGIAGFLIFLSMINIGLNLVAKKGLLPNSVAGIIILISLVLMIFKRPLYQKLSKQKISYPNNDKGGYYIEGSFSLLETLISILSNIISFIRVGAFAINHVGLFLAFQTLGEMIGNSAGNFIVLLIGNIIIIGLEGLIVFIQSLRLEYYELFSKYFTGDGYKFEPAKVKLKEN